MQISRDIMATAAVERPTWTPISSLPTNPPHEAQRVEEIVKRVVEDHRETLEKLADE